ncbi:serine/threonine-protein kinase fused [Contarinia nasturtii]|uniref:serine/threonine-protein kinase fused n=1 Tax=Contarinia nasturtii TaxID=265458 RepID=UPI0012D3B62C|nr:serine/threonine-protein kinase fused [Contarinia nasturtii]
MELKNYDLIKQIGEGTYGKVFQAREKATNRCIAVKLIKKSTNPSERERKEQKKFLKECNIHSSLSHPNIIQMLSSFENVEYIVVVTELAGIDLHRFLAQKHNKLSDKHVQKLTWNLLSALYYLHSHGVIHRDLKPQNVLLNNHQNIDEMSAKLCDFGLARQMPKETYLLTSVKGTPLYMAPEVMDVALYDERADLWSFGCIIYEAHFGKPPIRTQSFTQLMKWHRNPEIEWPSTISDESKSFVEGLLKKEPEKRFSWAQIIEHPYVKGNLVILDNNKAERRLTVDLTVSQQIRKEKQRDEIILNRGKKAIAEAMKKCKPSNNSKIPDTGPNGENNKHKNVIGDNESISSNDSVNAIIQTDLETDVEGPLVKRPIKVQTESDHIDRGDNQNLIIKRYTDNFSAINNNVDEQDNTNLKIGTMLENIEKMQLEDENKLCAAKVSKETEDETKDVNTLEMASTSNQAKANTKLGRRKLGQNLDNFSIRLGKRDDKEKPPCASEERKEQENVDTKQNEDDSPLIENEEWLAFIRKRMQELLNGETNSLKDQNLVGIIVPILRNFNSSSTVIGSVVQLLSIPFVLPISDDDAIQIRAVYLQTKLLPNLIFASKIICMVKISNPSFSSTISSSDFGVLGTTQEQIVFKRISDLSVDQLKTLSSIYELACYLIHSNGNFLEQFCDSMYMIANDLLRHLLKSVVYDVQGMQLVCAIVSILCFVLRESPENAELVESVIFYEGVDIVSLLQNGNSPLRLRLCNFLRIISRFSWSALQKSWTKDFKQTLESLLDESNVQIKEAARLTIDELSHLSFYNV